MNGFLYDIKKTLTGKFTIIIIILLVLVTAASAYGAGITSNASNPDKVAFVIPYISENGNNTTVSDYAINGYGQPVANLPISSVLSNSSKTVTIDGTTNSYGYFNSSRIDITVSNVSRLIDYTFPDYYKNGKPVPYDNMTIPIDSSKNFTIALYGYNSEGYNINIIQNNTIAIDVASVHEKDSGTAVKTVLINRNSAMPDISIYYNISSLPYTSAYAPGSTFSSSGLTYIGKSTTPYYSAVLPLNIRDNGKFVNIYLVNSTENTHHLLAAVSYEYIDLNPGLLLQNDLAIFFGILFIPILGIFSAYFYYSKDKASGVMESILARPITRGRLFLSRFLGNSISFFVGILLSLVVADLILFVYTQAFISTATFITIFAGYAIEAVAFAGIMYLITQFIKSSGAILGSGIGLLFIFGFMWNTIISVAILFELHIKSSLYLKDLFIVDAVSPAYFPDIIADYHLGVYSTLTASSVGINIYSVVLIGLIWLIVPAGIALFISMRRD